MNLKKTSKYVNLGEEASFKLQQDELPIRNK